MKRVIGIRWCFEHVPQRELAASLACLGVVPATHIRVRRSMRACMVAWICTWDEHVISERSPEGVHVYSVVGPVFEATVDH